MWIYDPEFSCAGRSIRTHLSVLMVNSVLVRRDPSAKLLVRVRVRSRYEKIVLMSTPIFRGGLPFRWMWTVILERRCGVHDQPEYATSPFSILYRHNNVHSVNGNVIGQELRNKHPKRAKKTNGKICTIIFSINNSFKINDMIQLFGLTEAISRFTVGTSLRYPMATHDGSTMR